MFIGKRNDVTVTGIHVPDVIEPPENGNPLKHERLKLWWTQVHSMHGIDIHLKLVRGGSIPFLRIKDKPNSPFRGIHLYLPAEEDIPLFKRFIKYAASPLGYNVVHLRC